MPLVRFVGGPLHGTKSMVNGGNAYATPYYQGLPRHDAGGRELPEYFKYTVHKIEYYTAHFHYYAFPEGLSAVEGMNLLWDAARETRSGIKNEQYYGYREENNGDARKES